MGPLPASAALCNGFGYEQAIAEYIFAALLGRPVPLISGNSLTGFSLLDWLALIIFGFGWLGYELVQAATLGPVHRPPSDGGVASRSGNRARSAGLSTLGTPPLRRRKSPRASGPWAL